MPFGSGLEDEAAITIGALHEVFVAHFEIDLRVAERSADTFASDLCVFDFNDFGSIDRHWDVLLKGEAWIISAGFAPASALRALGGGLACSTWSR
jgi:hypothetical protein